MLSAFIMWCATMVFGLSGDLCFENIDLTNDYRWYKHVYMYVCMYVCMVFGLSEDLCFENIDLTNDYRWNKHVYMYVCMYVCMYGIWPLRRSLLRKYRFDQRLYEEIDRSPRQKLWSKQVLMSACLEGKVAGQFVWLEDWNSLMSFNIMAFPDFP